MKHVVVWILIVGLAGCSEKGQQAAGERALPPSSVPATATPPSSVSGTYMAFGHDTATDQVFIEALRITQSGPGQFTGTLETTEVNKVGKTTANSQNVTGTFDGNHATIALDQMMGHVNREATMTPDAITMTWMQNGQLATEPFARKTDADYASLLQSLGHAATAWVATDAAVAKAQEANKATADLVDRLHHFLNKEATWSLSPAQLRQQKVTAYGDAGLARVKHLLALHQSMAQVSANTVAIQMNTMALQLGVALDSDAGVIDTGRQKMTRFDRDIALSPCLAPDGSLVPNPLPSCAPLPDLVSRYRAIHEPAASTLTQLSRIDEQTRSEYEARVKQAQDLVDAAH